MTQSTYLCYCIGVTHESLYYATKAYEPLQGPLRFIRLIQQRLTRRALSNRNHGAIEQLPVEIWELIKHELVDLELDDARVNLEARVKAHPCTAEEQGWPDCEVVNWNTTRDGCQAAYDFSHDLIGVSAGADLKTCRKLLRSYGLCMSSTEPLFNATRASDSFYTPSTNPDSVAIIALPAQHENNLTDTTDHPAHNVPVVDDHVIYNDAVVNVSFDVPANADRRFRALLRDLHLVPIEISDGEVRLAGLPTSSAAAGKRTRREYAAVKAEEVRPRWKLFSTAFADW